MPGNLWKCKNSKLRKCKSDNV